MIAHLVLFRPRPDLSIADREALIASLEHALTSVPSIRRARVGRRILLGREYEQQNARDFPFAVILEFATDADLRAYLDHPAHHELGQHFYDSSELAQAYDFELIEAEHVRKLLKLEA